MCCHHAGAPPIDPLLLCCELTEDELPNHGLNRTGGEPGAESDADRAGKLPRQSANLRPSRQTDADLVGQWASGEISHNGHRRFTSIVRMQRPGEQATQRTQRAPAGATRMDKG